MCPDLLTHVIPSITHEEQQWLIEIEGYLQQQIANAELNIPQIATNFAMTDRNFQRKLKCLTGVTPARYLTEIRLNAARQLLEKRTFDTIAQVAYEVGFLKPKSFSRNFKQRFGKAPSEYLK